MSVWIDIKYALRLLMKKPMFAATSVLIVAIGLGLTVYTWTLLNQLIFKPMTLNGDTPLVAIEGEFKYTHGRGLRADPYHLKQVIDESRLLQGMSMYRTQSATLSGMSNQTRTRKLHAANTQWNLFEMAGVQPILGRGFSPQDQDVGAESFSVISYDIWQNYFAGDENIIGTNAKVNGELSRIIGVMPQGFALPGVAQIWQPLSTTQLYPPQPSDTYRDALNAVGRLKAGVSQPQFQQELKAILAIKFQELPQDLAWRATSPGGYMRAFPFKLTNNDVYQHYSIFVVMLTVVVLILLLTCINIGNLLLARVNERIKEVAIRISLGIPRKRLILQMLWESIFICSLGGIVAYAFAFWGVSLTNSVFDQIFSVNGARPFWWSLRLEIDSIIVLAVAILLMVVVTGFIPAWRALSQDVNSVLRDGTRGALSKKAGRANKALVVTEIALSCVVLVIATMLLSNSYSAQNSDYGVDATNRITATLQLPRSSYPHNDLPKRNDFYYRLKDSLEERTNINGVAYFTSLPGTGGGSSHFEIQGKAAPVYNENPVWNFELVNRGAWGVAGMKIIAGRDFDLRDVESGESPVLINESMAKEHFPNGDAIGQQVRTVDEGDWHTEWRTIVGIVSDSVHGSIVETTSANHTGYGLMDLRAWTMDVIVHYSGSESQARNALIEAINNIDADVSAYHIQSYKNLIKEPLLLVNAVNSIFLWCGLVALFLAASGIYAVSANSITLRSMEIATRRALGSRDAQIIQLFLKEAGVQLAFGLGIGLTLSLWVINQLTQSMIIDGASYLIGLIGIPFFIIVMVIVATLIPATKITNQQPSVALRQS